MPCGPNGTDRLCVQTHRLRATSDHVGNTFRPLRLLGDADAVANAELKTKVGPDRTSVRKSGKTERG